MAVDTINLERRKAIIVLLGVLVTAIALALAVRNDIRDADAEFTAQNGAIERLLTRRLDNLNASLRSLSGMHHAMTRLSQQELSAFAQEIAGSQPYVRAIVQLRLVDDAERGTYEEQFQESGFPTFVIAASDGSGKLTPSPRKPQYMPLNFVEPLSPALARYLGLDFYADPELKAALDRAAHSGQVAAAPSPTLAEQSFLLIKSVYKGYFVPDAAQERLAQADGAYALLIDSSVFVGEILNESPMIGLRLSTWHGAAETMLFEKPAPSPSGPVAQWLPEHVDDVEIPLGPVRFNLVSTRELDGQIFRPMRWITLVTTFVGLYVAGALVVFTRLRAAEAASEAKEQLFRDMKTSMIENVRQAKIPEDLKLTLIKDLQSATRK